MRHMVVVEIKRRPRLTPFPGEGYRRAKRSAHPVPLKSGAHVVYEDRRGTVHRRAFQIVSLTRTSAVIKGWPDGTVRKGPMKRLTVMRSALIDVGHVQDEEFKAVFGVPEDSKGVQYDYFTIIEKPKRRRKERRG